MRSVAVSKDETGIMRLFLNGKPYFHNGLLDQGYWPDGLYTAPSDEALIYDIQTLTDLGFNMLRKHIKVEPEEFYYQCDKLGMIVFQDMVNNGHYSFAKDTALPTVARFTQHAMPDKFLNRNPKARKRFLQCMEAEVNQLKNHPSILQWTIFNEAWGQFDSDNVYEQFKKLDDTRFVDSTSGWFRRKKSDVDSFHVYFKKVNLKAGKKPLVLSEFGGKTYKAEGHIFNPDKTYGYGGCETLEALNEALVSLYMNEIVPAVKTGLCAAIYTQVSDVEDEINGLVTYDRKLEKINPEKLLPIASALQQALEG
jgi:beta-galactosidase/beta-glucuronidase